MNYGPHLNDGSHIFTFGSNLAGRHGRGAALDARNHWGAEYGVGVGRTGMAYAIPTKGNGDPMPILSLKEIQWHVVEFLHYTAKHPELTFLVTAIGCGLAGYTSEDIAPFFAEAPFNCVLPAEFIAVLQRL